MGSRTAAFRLPVLAQATASLLRAEPRLAALPHVADLVSTYLDTSVLLTPPHATARGFTGLLDRVLLRVMQDPAVDEAFRDHWLARAMEVAIKMDSLAMHGTLEMVEWIVENRSDRLCCARGAHSMCETCLNAAVPGSISSRDSDAIVGWLDSMGVTESRLRGLVRHAEALRRLDAQGVLDVQADDNLLTSVISRGPPTADTLLYLIERGATLHAEKLYVALATGAYQRELEPVIDIVVESRICDSIRDKFVWRATRVGGAKVLQWNTAFMSEPRVWGTPPLAQKAAYFAAQFCHVDALMWLWEHAVAPARVAMRRPTTEEDLSALYQWMHDSGVDGWSDDDSECAARKGYLSVIQWLHKHRPDRLTHRTMEAALTEGHMKIVQWLHLNCSIGYAASTLVSVSHNGHLQAIQWISANSSHGHGDTNKAMLRAAMVGHLEVLEWLHANRNDACVTCVLRCAFLLWEVPALPVLRWLAKNSSRRASTCVGRCLEEPRQRDFTPSRPVLALSQGDVDVARFLLDYQGTFFAVEPLEMIIQGGHLPAIQWLYAEVPESIDWERLLQLARQDRKERIVEWIQSVGVGGDQGE